jgi:hypothetical protein
MPLFDEELWDDAQLAKELELAPQTPAAWRSRKQGPPYIKIGKLVRYLPSRVREWAEGREIRPSGDWKQIGDAAGAVVRKAVR